MRGTALQTSKNINGRTGENLGESLAVFRRKDIKSQSMASAKHMFQKFFFNPANQKLVGFPEELQKRAKDAFVRAAHAVIEQIKYAKMPPHLKISLNQAHSENDTYEKVVTLLETDLELNSLEATDELQVNAVSHYATNANAERPKLTCHRCKNPRNYRKQCRLPKKQRKQAGNTQKKPGNRNSGANNSVPNNNTNTNNNNYKNSNRAEKMPEIVYPHCETCGKTNHSTARCYFRVNAANRPLP